MKVSFLFWIADYIQKRESLVLLENETMIPIEDMFDNGKPGIVLKTIKGVNIKTNSLCCLLESSLKLGIVVLVMFIKMLYFLSTFTLDMGRDSKNPIFQFVSSVSFETNVLWNGSRWIWYFRLLEDKKEIFHSGNPRITLQAWFTTDH